MTGGTEGNEMGRAMSMIRSAKRREEERGRRGTGTHQRRGKGETRDVRSKRGDKGEGEKERGGGMEGKKWEGQ